MTLLYWNFPLLVEHGATNANQLAQRAQISYPAARRMYQAAEKYEPIVRIDTHTMLSVADAFGLADPRELLLVGEPRPPRRNRRR